MSPTEKPAEFRQIDEVWGLHDLARTLADPPAGGGGCVAFVVDSRYIPADFDPQVELRLAASFGDNPYPATRSRGFCEPEPTSEKCRFGVHIIGIRGKRMAVFDMGYTDSPADGCKSAEEASLRAREILAGITEEDYVRSLISNPHETPLPPVRRSGSVVFV